MPSFSTFVLILSCVASAAVIPRDPPTIPETTQDSISNVLRLLQSDPTLTPPPDPSIQLVPRSSTDVRGNSPNHINLATDIIKVPSTSTVTADMKTTDNFLFSGTLAAFLDAKKAEKPSSLIWRDDGCSKSEDFPAGFNFLHSCMRHDFGYRNYKAQGRFTEANRKRLDDNFLADLNRECDKQSFFPGLACKATAKLYHKAVRKLAGL
ncbi:hypothetical protein Q9L58_009018 [Maublancomyces gigas]|uniref:Prokaryotic phospholipase A2-domain-containing protein n=1 Tax=Discina gigas TaxID=1032678 RepID=A0ABR3G8C0_9PEZI